MNDCNCLTYSAKPYQSDNFYFLTNYDIPSTHFNILFECNAYLIVALVEMPEEEPIGEAPEFTVTVQNCSVKEGKVASFSCRVIGEPTPELTWQLNGEPLTIEGRYTVVERDGLQLLQVHNVVTSDAGEYMVTAKNNHGEATSSANMTVEGRIYSFYAHSII